MHPPRGRRRGPPLTSESFSSPLHDRRTAALLGIALGLAFAICFLTGLLSHLIQKPPSWFLWPARPAWLYRVTQGVHVATGVATIPLLLAKLWVVYPHFWTWPPVRGAAHLVERVSLVPLVGGSLFMLFSGVANIARWYPWRFSFPITHYWVSWITIGALVAHIASKLAITRAALSAKAVAPPGAVGTPVAAGDGDGLGRRGFLVSVAAAAGVLTLATVGQTLRPLQRLALLAPRRPRTGPQGVPVNKTAGGAKVVELAQDPGYRLIVEGRGVATPLSLSLDDLRAMPQREATLPIACVEGWSSTASWRGVPVRDLLALAGARPRARVRVESLQARGGYRTSPLNRLQAADPDTLLAMELFGEPLHIDHGYPVRLIGPNRPGVQQTKWVARLVVR
ncbi:MAG: molybdopterin-dependent oxidoreductase [Acidimicrobiales bacterium]